MEAKVALKLLHFEERMVPVFSRFLLPPISLFPTYSHSNDIYADMKQILA